MNILGTALVLGSEDVLMANNVLVLGNVYGGKKFTNPEHPLWFRICLTTKRATHRLLPLAATERKN